jgi:hypothetical protein
MSPLMTRLAERDEVFQLVATTVANGDDVMRDYAQVRCAAILTLRPVSLISQPS